MAYRLLHLIPKNYASHLFGSLTRARLPFGLHSFIKTWFIRHFKVDVAEAEFPLASYPTLGDFFIRRLKPGARPLAPDAFISPVDGTLTQWGRFDSDNPRLTQIKGMDYGLKELLGPDLDPSAYLDGGFITIYLAPYNYHRIHSPIAGSVSRVGYVPGALWPVNTWSVSHIPRLFTVNERISVELEGEAGKAVVVMVGATNVGRITLDFHSSLAGNLRPRAKERLWRPQSRLILEKGAGLGCFELGSTVILILSRGLFDRIDPSRIGGLPRTVRMGEGLGP